MIHFNIVMLSTVIFFYYMANYVSGQDEPYPAVRFATREGKMELSYPFGITRCLARKFLRRGGRFTKIFFENYICVVKNTFRDS